MKRNFAVIGFIGVILGTCLFALGCEQSDDKAQKDQEEPVAGEGEGKGEVGGQGEGEGEGEWGEDQLDSASHSGSMDTPQDEAETDNVEPEPQCDTDKPVTLYLSADDSNSMAGATVARALIRQQQVVFKAIRTYEFLNYYSFDFTPAEPGTVRVEADMSKNDDGTFNLQIGVRAPDQDIATRRSMNLSLAIDTSESMGWGKEGSRGLDRAIESCRALAGALKKGDVVSVLLWNSKQTVALDAHRVAGENDQALIGVCESLSASGRSDLGAGLAKAYQLCEKSFDVARINRVILISDGGANLNSDDRQIIADKAKSSMGDGIYLMGVGVGDPWNYSDQSMDSVTEAGKGAYVFIDTMEEAGKTFSEQLLSNLELAALDVRVELNLPPTFSIKKFHGEQISTVPDEVEPQHLGMGDAMIYHQVLESCDLEAVSPDATIRVVASYTTVDTHEKASSVFEVPISTLLDTPSPRLLKGNAVVAYAECLKEVRSVAHGEALPLIDNALDAADTALSALPEDRDLAEIQELLVAYRRVFEAGPVERNPGPSKHPIGQVIGEACNCNAVGTSLVNLSCALELCDPEVLISQTRESPTNSSMSNSFAALTHYGNPGNDLSPPRGRSFAVMATGPVEGTHHSEDLGGGSVEDPFDRFGSAAYNVMEWRLRLRAPDNAHGFRLQYLFLSEEYDDYIGSRFNDKFYIRLEAGSTNGGEPTVINYGKCRDEDEYFDFRCSPGNPYCTPGERYCYIAINSGLSECCWYQGCPNGRATTDISGTGFECAANSADGPGFGSSTGWLKTEWPIEPGEEFHLVFHIHDTGDGIFDSAVILDDFSFMTAVEPGTAH